MKQLNPDISICQDNQGYYFPIQSIDSRRGGRTVPQTGRGGQGIPETPEPGLPPLRESIDLARAAYRRVLELLHVPHTKPRPRPFPPPQTSILSDSRKPFLGIRNEFGQVIMFSGARSVPPGLVVEVDSPPSKIPTDLTQAPLPFTSDSSTDLAQIPLPFTSSPPGRQDFRRTWQSWIKQNKPWSWFVTLTFTTDVSVKQSLKLFKVYFGRLSQATKEIGRHPDPDSPPGSRVKGKTRMPRASAKYVLAVEETCKGRVHLHVLLGGKGFDKLSMYRWQRRWEALSEVCGMARIYPAVDRAAPYLTKYITKGSELYVGGNFVKWNNNLLHPPGKRKPLSSASSGSLPDDYQHLTGGSSCPSSSCEGWQG